MLVQFLGFLASVNDPLIARSLDVSSSCRADRGLLKTNFVELVVVFLTIVLILRILRGRCCLAGSSNVAFCEGFGISLVLFSVLSNSILTW